jgi:hypothetical protein
MIDVRVRTTISPDEMEGKVGKIVTDNDYNVLLTRACMVRSPAGPLLALYLPGVLAHTIGKAHDRLAQIRMRTDNRGNAGGSKRIRRGSRERAINVLSNIVGYLDPAGPARYCRLTAFNASDAEGFDELVPLFQEIGGLFSDHVPDRYRAQLDECARTHPDWIIPGTPFTTITVNNSYATGVHKDVGDLDKGFSCLAVSTRGPVSGLRLVFPEYRVGVDMRHGDLLLMDAHQWHGNTRMRCQCGVPDVPAHMPGPCRTCHAERISVVCYFRTGMTACASRDTEDAKRTTAREHEFART